MNFVRIIGEFRLNCIIVISIMFGGLQNLFILYVYYGLVGVLFLGFFILDLVGGAVFIWDVVVFVVEGNEKMVDFLFSSRLYCLNLWVKVSYMGKFDFNGVGEYKFFIGRGGEYCEK